VSLLHTFPTRQFTPFQNGVQSIPQARAMDLWRSNWHDSLGILQVKKTCSQLFINNPVRITNNAFNEFNNTRYIIYTENKWTQRFSKRTRFNQLRTIINAIPNEKECTEHVSSFTTMSQQITSDTRTLSTSGVKRKLKTHTIETKFHAIADVERGIISKAAISKKYEC